MIKSEHYMRYKLGSLYNQRKTFCGIFQKFGLHTNYKGWLELKLLLIDITEFTEPAFILTDHLWFNQTKAFNFINDLKSGDILEFKGRVKCYEKGYRENDEENPKRIDYRISFVTKVRKVGFKSSSEFNFDDFNQKQKELVENHNELKKKAIEKYVMNRNQQNDDGLIDRIIVLESQEKKLNDFWMEKKFKTLFDFMGNPKI